MDMNYNRNHNVLDEDICRRLLNRCHVTLVDGIYEHDNALLLCEMERTELLSSTEIKDINMFLHMLSF